MTHEEPDDHIVDDYPPDQPKAVDTIPEEQIPEEYRELFSRALRSVRIEQSLRDKLVMLQESQRVDLEAFNDLQLRLNARAVAIKVIEQSLEEE